MTSEFTAITTVGGLLPVDLLVRIAAGDGDLPAIKASDYGLAATERTREAIARSWNRLSGLWQAYEDRLTALPDDDPATTPTRELWILPLLDELRFAGLALSTGLEIEGRGYPISHLADAVPIHILGAGTRLDVRTPGRAGAAQLSPHALVQEYLSRSDDHLWGIVTNGRRLRLLRDSTSLTKQAYVEFDLEAIFSEGLFADFTTLWMTLHCTRFTGSHPEDCVLEQWLSVSHERGVRALDHLRDGVKAAIERLGAGFISHPGNGALRERLRSGDLDAQDYYRQLLRVVYRILFLLVAEERGLLHPPDTPGSVRQRYEQHYSISRLRRLAERRRGTAHSDRWEGIKVVTAALGGIEGLPTLGLPALGSLLWVDDSTFDLTAAHLSNADLLAAMRSLALVEDPESRRNRRIDYRNMGTEELGSVYESLLELEPIIHLESGAFQLAAIGDERRDTGAHYTPPTILAKVLDFALDPQIADRLRQPDPEASLLDLRVLDPAVGSGHFLIAAGHRIARALAQVRTGEQEPSPEVQRLAFRDVVARCLYGVDVNPMAVELAKVALWLEALDPGKPLSFLDHHIRCGNSLLGVPLGTTVARDRAAVERHQVELASKIALLEATLRDARGDAVHEIRRALDTTRRLLAKCRYDSWADSIPDEAFKRLEDDVASVCTSARRTNTRERDGGVAQLGFGTVALTLPADLVADFNSLGAAAEEDVLEATARAATYEGAVTRIEYRRALEMANTWTAAWFWPKRQMEPTVPTHGLMASLRQGTGNLSPDQARLVQELADTHRFFHYELHFPEVFALERGGFDIILGNPPYLGGMKISGSLGHRVLHFLKTNHHEDSSGRADLAAYFVRRAFDAVRESGDVSFITTNTIAQGDTREVGLAPVLRWGGRIANAIRSTPWEGEANLSVAIVHLKRGQVGGDLTLDGLRVDEIGPDLGGGPQAADSPLKENLDCFSAGTNVLGQGFWINGAMREQLIAEDPSNADVIKPFVGAKHALQATDPSQYERWVIDFEDRQLAEAAKFVGPMRIVEELVRPRRETANEARVREGWWKHGRPATRLYQQIRELGLAQVVAFPEVSKTMLPVMLQSDAVFQHKLVIFLREDLGFFGALSSSFHWLWAAKRCTTLESRPVYNPGQCFVGFPLPSSEDLSTAGRSLLDLRTKSQLKRDVGLTKLYNFVIDQGCQEPDINEVRSAHVALDEAVARAYGWDDLIERFDHGHHPTERFGIRWTVRPETQREIEKRLLELNLARAASEGT